MLDRGVDTCRCQGCQGLRDRYRKDPVLLHFYARNLLKRGWAGGTDDVEKAYMAAHAPWYRTLQVRGAALARKHPLRRPKAVTEKASKPPAEVNHLTLIPGRIKE